MKNNYLVLMIVSLMVLSITSCLDIVPVPRNNIYDPNYEETSNGPTGILSVSDENPHVGDEIVFTLSNISDDSTSAQTIQFLWMFNRDRESHAYDWGNNDWVRDKNASTIYYKEGNYTAGVQLKNHNGDTRAYVKNIKVRPLWKSLGFPVSLYSLNSWGTNYALTVNPISGHPLVALIDAGASNRATVYEWNGSDWISLGNCGTGNVSDLKLKADSTGDLVIALKDTDQNNSIHVLKRSSGVWNTIGLFEHTYGDVFDLEIDANDTPVLMISSASQIKKWSSGTAWTDVFDKNATTYTDMAFDGLGNVYLASDQNNTLKIYKYINGSSGFQTTEDTQLGTIESYIHTGVSEAVLNIGSDNLPFITYKTTTNSYIWTKKYSSEGNWTDLNKADSDATSSFVSTIELNSNFPVVTVDRDARSWRAGTTWSDFKIDESNDYYSTYALANHSSGKLYALAMSNSGKVYIYIYEP